MNNHTSNSPFQPPVLAPLAFWANGFEYAFGYQLKLIRQFWGIGDDAD